MEKTLKIKINESLDKLHSYKVCNLKFPRDCKNSIEGRYSLPGNSESQTWALKTNDAFVLKVQSVLEMNIDNDEFIMDDLCRELAVSHANLYRKFKSGSNRTVADYFKLLRLKKSKELLSDSTLNITQIAFAVGFKNLSHYSREFSRIFGKSPREVRKSLQ